MTVKDATPCTQIRVGASLVLFVCSLSVLHSATATALRPEFLKGLDQLAKDERRFAELSSRSIFDYMTNIWEFANVWISLVGLYADYRSIFPAKESQPTEMCQQLEHISSQLADLQASVRDISSKIQRTATKLS